MKAAVLESKENIKIIEVPVPDVRDNEALIKVKSCGLCGTDIHAYRGEFMPHFPLILGHEFSGIVVKTGSRIKSFKNGDRVVVSPEIYCNKCFNCRRGEEKYCFKWQSIGTTIDGAFAEFISVNEKCLHSLPDNISFDEGAFVEPAACVYSGIRVIPEYFDKSVIILGAGSIGLIHLKCLVLRNPLRLDVIDVSEEKLKKAREFGAGNTYNVKDCEDYYELINKKYDVVIDCTGVPSVLEKGFRLLDKNGHFIFFGVAPNLSEIKINPYQIYENSWKITGVYPDMKNFGTIIKMMEAGLLDFKPLISRRYSLDDFIEAFNFFINPGENRLKILIYNE